MAKMAKPQSMDRPMPSQEEINRMMKRQRAEHDAMRKRHMKEMERKMGGK